MKRTLAIWALTAAEVMAQSTMTGSKTMQGSWDASGASATKPAKSGATLPATCNIGEFFFNTAAAAGQNLYLCAATNTWTQVTSGASGAVNSVFGRTGAVSAQSGDYGFSQLSGTANSGQLPAAGGDLSGALTSATVTGIQGKTVSSTAPYQRTNAGLERIAMGPPDHIAMRLEAICRAPPRPPPCNPFKGGRCRPRRPPPDKY